MWTKPYSGSSFTAAQGHVTSSDAASHIQTPLSRTPVEQPSPTGSFKENQHQMENKDPLRGLKKAARVALPQLQLQDFLADLPLQQAAFRHQAKHPTPTAERSVGQQ